MESIKDMIDVNTIVGDAVETPDGTVIIPISRVAFGFAAGGGDYEAEEVTEQQGCSFGGGSGAGVSVRPVGFLVCTPDNGVRFLPVQGNLVYDRVIDLIPQVLNKIQSMLDKKQKNDELEDLAKTAETQATQQ
jgi:sporulation protein YtfJ